MLLVVLRIKNRDLYRRVVKNECLPSEVINYIDEIVLEDKPNSSLSIIIADMEIDLCSFNRTASEQIILIMDQKDPTHPEYLSEKTKKFPERIINALQLRGHSKYFSYRGDLIGYISSLIELVEMSGDSG